MDATHRKSTLLLFLFDRLPLATIQSIAQVCMLTGLHQWWFLDVEHTRRESSLYAGSELDLCIRLILEGCKTGDNLTKEMVYVSIGELEREHIVIQVQEKTR